MHVQINTATVTTPHDAAKTFDITIYPNNDGGATRMHNLTLVNLKDLLLVLKNIMGEVK